jgi:hypothetical protein
MLFEELFTLKKSSQKNNQDHFTLGTIEEIKWKKMLAQKRKKERDNAILR